MRKFNRLSKHRKSMFRTMSNQLIEHGQIETTLEKAKELRSIIEKLITKAKIGNLNKEKELQIRRLLSSRLHNNEKNTNILMKEIAPKLLDRNGGYTRIIKSGFRNGDKGNKAYIQIINF
jgi:large subunit ribosomal protein L17